jgi:acetylornithine deacetylase/succinyl-diaminopimelate desuccinylase-like protein
MSPERWLLGPLRFAAPLLAVLAAPLTISTVLAASPSPPPAAVREWVRSHEIDILHEFAALLSIPNLARDGPNIRRNAEHIAALLGRRGLNVRLLDGEGGPPAVYGERSVPGARRTIAIYAHYDGQPATEADWATPPWTPTLRDGPVESGGRAIPLEGLAGPTHGGWLLYGRSAGDDKAPIVALLAALDALAFLHATPSVSLKVFFEGEEEGGSPHLRAVLEKNKARLSADAWLLCDGPVHQSRRPLVFFGVRGVTDVELTLYGPSRALHSGHYGNWAPNPAVELAHLVDGLRDPDGRIKIAGFYDDVRPLTESERAALRDFPSRDADLRNELALAATEASGAPLVERLMLPALNLRGLQAGAVGDRAANAIPTEARASIDFRLVPDQTPDRVKERFEAHLRAQGYAVVYKTPTLDERRATPRLVQLQWHPGYPSARTPLDSPFARALVALVGEASGTEVVRQPTLGGSMPMHLFPELLGATAMGLPMANHDDNQHAANENLRLQNLWDGTVVFATVLTGLGEAWP